MLQLRRRQQSGNIYPEPWRGNPGIEYGLAPGEDEAWREDNTNRCRGILSQIQSVLMFAATAAVASFILTFAYTALRASPKSDLDVDETIRSLSSVAGEKQTSLPLEQSSSRRQNQGLETRIDAEYPVSAQASIDSSKKKAALTSSPHLDDQRAWKADSENKQGNKAPSSNSVAQEGSNAGSGGNSYLPSLEGTAPTGNSSAPHSRIVGLAHGDTFQAGQVIQIDIEMRDGHDNVRWPLGGDSILIRATGPSILVPRVTAKRKDGGGYYTAKMTFIDPGEYEIDARLDFINDQGGELCPVELPPPDSGDPRATKPPDPSTFTQMVEPIGSSPVMIMVLPHTGDSSTWSTLYSTAREVTEQSGRWVMSSCSTPSSKVLDFQGSQPGLLDYIQQSCKAGLGADAKKLWIPFKPLESTRLGVFNDTCVEKKWVHLIGDSLDMHFYRLVEEWLPKHVGWKAPKYFCYMPPAEKGQTPQVNDPQTSGVQCGSARKGTIHVFRWPDKDFVLSLSWMTGGHFKRVLGMAQSDQWSEAALDKAESRKKVRPDLMFEQGFSEAMLAAVGKSVPDVVEMNYGLHYVGEASRGQLVSSYQRILTTLFESLKSRMADLKKKADSPNSSTPVKLIWRRTATTHFDSASLHELWFCRSRYRLEMMDDVAVSLAKEHGFAIHDTLEITKGRGESTSDNRHYDNVNCPRECNVLPVWIKSFFDTVCQIQS